MLSSRVNMKRLSKQILPACMFLLSQSSSRGSTSSSLSHTMQTVYDRITSLKQVQFNICPVPSDCRFFFYMYKHIRSANQKRVVSVITPHCFSLLKNVVV